MGSVGYHRVGSRPIGTEHEQGPAVLQRAERICADGTFTDAVLHPSHVVDRVKRIDLSDNTQLAKSCKVVRFHHLSVYHPETPVAWAVHRSGHFDHVEQRVDRQIADGVNRRREPRGVRR